MGKSHICYRAFFLGAIHLAEKKNMGKKDKPVPAPPPGAAAAPPPETFDMVFHCQLAHGSPTRQIRDFTNVKQLYESIAKAFGIKSNDVRTM